MPGIVVGSVAKDGVQRSVKPHKADKLRLTQGRVRATLQDDCARLDAGIFKPRFGVAFQNGVNLEMP